MYLRMRVITMLGIFGSAFGCNSRAATGEIKSVILDDVGDYMLIGGYDRQCELIRNESQRYSFPQSKHRSKCDRLPPGLSTMQHGYATKFFSSTEANQGVFEASFYFTCDKNKTSRNWKGYQLPDEIKHLTGTENTINVHRAITTNKFSENANRDPKFNDAGDAYVFILPLLGRSLSDSITSAVYLLVHVRAYSVILENLKPTRQMKYMFLNLPEQFESNELLYYQFINTFGTGVITSTVFGGKIQVWATRDSLKTAILNTNINNIATLNPLLNRIIKLATLKTIHIEGGGFPGSKTAKDMFHWKKQIMMSPVSLQPNVMPINKFLDPSLNSAPSKGLAKIVKFEEQNHKLRRVLYALNSFESGRLFDFLKTNLALEITKVCPSQSLYSVIKRGILDEANVNLMKYVVICTHHSEYSDKYEQRVIFSRFYKLLPGLCLSITGNPPPCASSSFQAQTGITCLQFFKNRKCNEPVHMVVKNANESKRAFNSGSKSFKFCN